MTVHKRVHRIPAQLATSPTTAPHVPHDWPVAEAPAVLTFESPTADGEILELRLTNAWDVKMPLKVSVALAGSGERVGEIDASYAPPFVPQTCVIDRRLLPRVIEEGLALRVSEGDGPFRFHAADQIVPPELAAHLQLHDGRGSVQAALDRLASLASIQMFGWEEGCVSEALCELEAAGHGPQYRAGLDRHLAMFFAPDGGVRSMISGEEINDYRVGAIESTIMYTELARRQPDHPQLAAVEAFWKTREDAGGCVIDGMTSCEGAYTVAYPMACFALAASRRGDDVAVQRLTENALRQLRLRRERLSTAGGVFLRRYPDGRTTHLNWSRGLAWYLLGLVHTSRTLGIIHRRHEEDILSEIDQVARWVLAKRDASGLWHCFAGEPETGLETSSTAGICAAIATACDTGMLDRSLREELKLSWAALQDWLTPDGLLRGIAPSNRAGESYQRTGKRVMSPFGLGLWGQFAARML